MADRISKTNVMTEYSAIHSDRISKVNIMVEHTAIHADRISKMSVIVEYVPKPPVYRKYGPAIQ